MYRIRDLDSLTTLSSSCASSSAFACIACHRIRSKLILRMTSWDKMPLRHWIRNEDEVSSDVQTPDDESIFSEQRFREKWRLWFCYIIASSVFTFKWRINRKIWFLSDGESRKTRFLTTLAPNLKKYITCVYSSIHDL